MYNSVQIRSRQRQTAMREESETRPANPPLFDQWVESILRRSPDAWEELVEAYGDRLRGDIRISLVKRGLSPVLVEDIEQETWLRALRKIETFDWKTDEKFYNWLRSMSVNCIHELARNNSRTVSLEAISEDNSPEDLLDLLNAQLGVLGSSVEDDVIFREFVTALEHALRTLRPRDQEIYIRWLLGERPRMLAVIYHMTAASVSRLVYRINQNIEPQLRHLSSIDPRDKPNE